jgi:hypothetical protein
MKASDLIDLLEFFIAHSLRIDVSRGGEELLSMSAGEGRIDVDIKNEEGARELLKELRKWRS